MAAVNRRRLPLIAVVVILIPLAGIIYVLGSPGLESVSPPDGTTEVAASSPVRLAFSHPMRADSVEGRLVFDPVARGKISWEENTLVFTPERPWAGGKVVHVRLLPGSRLAGLLPFSMRKEIAWSFTVAEPRLAYLYPADGPANLYALNTRTNEVEQLTDSLAGLQDFSVNGQGSAIYYSVGNPQGGSDIYRLDLIGAPTGAGQVTRTPILILDCPQAACRNPQVSPQGNLLAYERSGFVGSNEPAYPRVWLLPLEDSTQPQGTAGSLAGAANHQTLQPDWSSTGVLSFYDTTGSAFVFLNPSGGKTQQVDNQTGQAGSWDPKGQFFLAPEISFITADTGDSAVQTIASSHLLRFSVPTGKADDLTRAENLEDTSPAYSPDGDQIAFARKYLDLTRWTPGRQLWLMDGEGRNARPLTIDSFFNHYDFAWDPSGRWLAYVRFNQTLLTEPPEVWVMDMTTDRARQLITGGFSPQWIP